MTMPADLDEMVAHLRDVNQAFTKVRPLRLSTVSVFSGPYRVSLGRRRVQWRAREPRAGFMRNKRMPMTRLIAAETRKTRDGSGWPMRSIAYWARG